MALPDRLARLMRTLLSRDALVVRPPQNGGFVLVMREGHGTREKHGTGTFSYCRKGMPVPVFRRNALRSSRHFEVVAILERLVHPVENSTAQLARTHLVCFLAEF